MGINAHVHMTADELLRLPDDNYLYELAEGVLVKLNPASSISAIVAMSIAVELMRHAEEHELGIVAGADWGFWLKRDPDTVRAPDAAFVRAERIPREGIPAGFWPGAPDLAVEVLSSTNGSTAVLEKVYEYLDAGTRLVWLVDPDARRLIAFRPGERWRFLRADDVLDGGDVLPGFRLLLSEIWI